MEAIIDEHGEERVVRRCTTCNVKYIEEWYCDSGRCYFCCDCLECSELKAEQRAVEWEQVRQ